MLGLRRVLCAGLCFAVTSVSALPPQYAFRISLKDKQGSPSVSNPLSFLSQRAIDRRNAQGIAIDTTDVPVSPVYINDILSVTGGKLHLTSKWQNYVVILLTDSSAMPTIRTKPYTTDVQYVGYFPDGLYKSGGGNIEGDALAKGTGSASYYGGTYEQTRLVNGDYLHDRGYKGKGKLIAVFDEGFAGVDTGPAFDSMMKSGRLVDKYNFVTATNNVFNAYNHGTGCLSTMAGNLPGTYVGSAPEAQYALYVSEYRMGDMPVELDQMVAATERADSVGADIISSSVAYNTFIPPFTSLTYADIDGKTTVAAKGANIATAKGMLFVITAGNEGGNTWNYILTPGDADSAITVGSVNNSKVPASNSGFGPNSSGRIKPDVCMQGQNATIMYSGPLPTLSPGTSYATPQLAGWAACLWQATTNGTPSRMRQAIIKSAHMYNTPGNQIGYGVPDFGLAHSLLGIKDTPKTVDADNWLTASPNPVKDEVTVWVYMQQAGKVSLVVNDAAGKQLYEKEYTLPTGKHQLFVPVSGMPGGVYMLNARTESKQKSIKLQKH